MYLKVAESGRVNLQGVQDSILLQSLSECAHGNNDLHGSSFRISCNSPCAQPQGPFGAGGDFLHLKRLHKVRKGTVDLEPNRKYATDVLRMLGMEGCKPVGTPHGVH
eukprot:1968989-Amphidinium_carterae.2